MQHCLAIDVAPIPGASLIEPLPDLHPPVGSEVQLLAGPHVERAIPGIEVPHRQDAVGCRRQDVGNDLPPQRGRAKSGPIILRKAQKEPLLGVNPSIIGAGRPCKESW